MDESSAQLECADCPLDVPADVRFRSHDHYPHSLNSHVYAAIKLQKEDRAKGWVGWHLDGMWTFDLT